MRDQNWNSDTLEKLDEIGRYLIMLANSDELGSEIEFRSAIPLRSASQISDVTTDNMRACTKAAYQEYQARLERRSFIGRDLLGEPAWDMLLDLFVARNEGCKLSVKAVCIAAQVPMTTALRWISVLEKEGLVERHPDTLDARRVWVELSDDGLFRMFSYFKNRIQKGIVKAENISFYPCEED